MAPLKLWMCPSACSLAPHILLREAELDFTIEKIAVDGCRFPASHLHLNPKGRVPILQLDDNTAITETPAILLAISQRARSKQLLGTTDLEAVRASEWMTWLSGYVHGLGFGMMRRPYRYVDDDDGSIAKDEDSEMRRSVMAKGRKIVDQCYVDIESWIRGPYALGDHFSAVDAYLFVFYRWGNEEGFDMEGRFPRFTSLARDLAARPSVLGAMKAEGGPLLGK